MSIASAVKATLRAVMAAAVIGTATLVGAPAQAAGLNFSISVSSGGTVFDLQDGRGRTPSWNRGSDRRSCVDSQQIYRRIAWAGYSETQLTGQTSAFIRARASKYGWMYSIRVDRCSGHVVQTSLLHRVVRNVPGQYNGRNSNGGGYLWR